jgi:crotonobetainyl-CoA:carnitine CoA-transferase CaiB-like acyl-CoA transferase
MYSPQLFEMLATVIHDERLANAERERLAYARLEDRHQARPSVADALRRGLVRAEIMLAFRARPIPASTHAD